MCVVYVCHVLCCKCCICAKYQTAVRFVIQDTCACFAGGSKSPVHENVAANRIARNKRKKTEGDIDFMTATARPNAQPDLCPRLTAKERHGNQTLQQHMSLMHSMHEKSEQAEEKRYAEGQQAAYEALIYQQQMRQFQIASQARMQQINHIQNQNDCIMRHWERTALADTPMPELKSIDLPQVPVPKPPKDPSIKRAEAAAALKAEAEAAATEAAAAAKAKAEAAATEAAHKAEAEAAKKTRAEASVPHSTLAAHTAPASVATPAATRFAPSLMSAHFPDHMELGAGHSLGPVHIPSTLATPGMTGDKGLQPCGGCGEPVGNVHSCPICNRSMHVFCGTGIGEEGFG